MKWHAGIGDSDLLRRYARLYVGQELPDGQMKVLLEDGTFTTIEREVHSERAGLVLPYEALTAVFEALESWKGLQSHQATEAKVLREWLNAERARVDKLMAAHIDGEVSS